VLWPNRGREDGSSQKREKRRVGTLSLAAEGRGDEVLTIDALDFLF